ncbi:MAG: type IX secretion system sortase PorU [Bacteroidales bacterium]|nr:type IX secretion system sortase PorU [Bacteroidales bacterium]
MNKFVLISYILLCCNVLRAQNSGNNPDIDPNNNYYKPCSSSILQNGKWIKIAINEDGVYKIPFQKLKELGFDNPLQVRVFGNDFGMLPFYNNEKIPSDLIENKVKYGDNAIYFYAKAKDIWYYNEKDDFFEVKNHLYDNNAYYFLSDVNTNYNNKIDNTETLSPNNPIQITESDYFAIHETEKINLKMSGRNWYGENFYYANSQNFEIKLPAIANNSKGKAKISVIARSSLESSYTILFNSTNEQTIKCNSISGTTLYADTKTEIFEFTQQNSDIQNVNITFNKPTSSAEGYLDYIILNTRGLIKYNDKQLIFRDKNSTKNNFSEYYIQSGNNNCIIWDITQSTTPYNIAYNINQEKLIFTAKSENLHEYVIFQEKDAFEPIYLEKSEQIVNNQNLHAKNPTEFIIISPQRFYKWAEKISQIHSADLSTMTVTTEQIYNEFSCGMRDVSAIRNFIRYIYKKDNGKTLKYVLLFGDGSVDNISNTENNTNIIPTYQCPYSLDEENITSFVTDDYFALLDDDEGEYFGNLDIAVGRIPIKNETDASTATNKIEIYSNQKFEKYQKWITFIADDENNNLHLSQADKIATFTETNYPNYDIQKIYIDAYKQEQSAGLISYPSAREDIINRFNEGAKIINYTGHGGVNFLADERILTNADIEKLININNLPIFITSSCDIGHFDNYDRQTDKNKDCPAEKCLNNPNGGAIAMVTAARVAYAEQNFNLNFNLFKNFFNSENNNKIRLGDVVKKAKNATNDINMHSFMLLGDPAIVLKEPDNKIKILKINDIDFNNFTDTLKALDKCKIECQIIDYQNNIVNSFNGSAHTIFFDKETTIKTLNNDGHGIFEYKTYKNKIFEGYSTVNNGTFTINFIVPKDIDYKVDSTKISLYAENGNYSASDSYKNILVGLSSSNPENDIIGPEIKLYVNNKDFENGIKINNSPILTISLSDTSGINTTSDNNGHNISLSIDNNQSISLNKYYKNNVNSYTSGSVEYKLTNIKEGIHTIKVKAWDNYNNSNEIEYTFEVTKNENLKITRLLNYPNPFTDITSFYFEHNAPQSIIDYELTIFSISGKQIKTIIGIMSNNKNLSDPIKWDGLDDFGDKIARGTYIYRLKIKDSEGKKTSAYEKLLYLK